MTSATSHLRAIARVLIMKMTTMPATGRMEVAARYSNSTMRKVDTDMKSNPPRSNPGLQLPDSLQLVVYAGLGVTILVHVY